MKKNTNQTAKTAVSNSVTDSTSPHSISAFSTSVEEDDERIVDREDSNMPFFDGANVRSKQGIHGGNRTIVTHFGFSTTRLQYA